MKIESFDTEIVKKTDVHIDYIVLHGDIVAYKQKTIESFPDSRRQPKTHTWQGICHMSEINKLKRSKEHRVMADGNYLCLSDELLEKVRRHGIDSLRNEDLSDTDQAFDLLASNELKPQNVVRADWADLALFSLDGRPVPVMVLFEYIMAHTDNVNFDLEKLRAELTKRKDISHLSEISSIPHYNATSKRNKCLTFSWAPSQKDFERIHASLKADKGRPVGVLAYYAMHLDIFKLANKGVMTKKGLETFGPVTVKQ